MNKLWHFRIHCHTHVTDTERHGQVIAVRDSALRLWKQLHNTPPLTRPVNCCVHTVFSPPVATRVANITLYIVHSILNPLTPNDIYMSRTALLTSKRCILYIYSTNVGTEYFKHALYFPFFFSSKCSLFHNANFFGSCIIHILYTGCAEIKKNNSGAKGLEP